MPIIGATDRESVEARYPLVGRLYKGGPKRTRKRKDGSEYQIFGEELPYFRFVSAKPGALEAFKEEFGAEPARMRAFLPYATADECFSTWVELWSGGGRLLYRSDGRRTVRRWLEDKKSFSDRAEDQIDHPRHEDEAWVGRLNLFFPELLKAGFPGTVMLTTHGKHDCTRISAALYALERDCRWRENGLAGVEVTISRQEVEHTDPDGAKRKHHDVFVEPSERFVLAALETARQEADRLLTAGTRLIDAQTGEVLLDTEGDSEDEPITAKVSEKPDPAPKARVQKGKPKQATLKGCGGWRIAATELADDTPFYMGEGGPDMLLMLQTAAELGHAEITDDNLSEVIEALTAHATKGAEGGIKQEEIPF